MKKAIWIISGLLTIIISLAYFYFRSSLVINAKSEVFSYVSNKTSFVISLQYDSDLTEVFKDDQNIPSFLYNDFSTELQQLDELIQGNQQLSLGVKSKSIYIACRKINAKTIGNTYIIAISDLKTDDLSTLFNQDDEPVAYAKARVFESENIYQYHSNRLNFYYTFDQSHLIVSFYPNLVEEAIKTKLNGTGIDKNAQLQVWQNKEKASKSLLKVYVNHTQLKEFLGVFCKLPLQKSLMISEEFADYSYSEMNYKSDAWILNGEVLANEKKYFHLLKSQTENRSYLINYLSNNTWAYQSLILSDSKLFRTDLRAQQKLINDFYYDAEMRLINKKYFIDISSFINENIGDEFLLAYFPDYSMLNRKGCVGMMILKQANVFDDQLTSLVKTPRLEEYKGLTIKAFPFRKLMYLSAGIPFKELESNFYTIMEDRLIVASTPQDLKKYIDDFQSDQLLKNNENYHNYISTLNDQYNYLFYVAISGYQSKFTGLLQDKANLKLNDRLGWSNYSAFTYQLTSSDAGLISSIYMPVISSYTETSLEQKWQITIDGTLSKEVQWVQTMDKKQTYAFAQDDLNNIYLIDENSTLKWKKSIAQPIVSDVKVVDYYKNGESQLLFNSANNLYLMDLNGNFMPNYPLKLAAEATNGLSLFDYEKDKNYRIFITCINQSVYGYDLGGRPLEGWSPKRVGDCDQKVQHINVQGKDFLFITNKQGYFYFFNRKAELKAQFKDSVGVQYHNPFVFDGNTEYAKNRFVSTDQRGKIKSVFIDGRRMYKSVGNWTENHYFNYANVCDDDKKDYIFLDNNQLMVYKDDSTLAFNYQFNCKINNAPFIFQINEQESLLGVFSEETQQVYLFDRNGALQPGFPIKACANPSFITQNNQKKMLVGTREGKIIYYNL